MKIDWKRIHDIVGDEYNQLQWDRDGDCYAWGGQPDLRANNTQWTDWSADGFEHSIAFLNGQCPGEWDKTIITFPGHYESDPIGFLSDLSGNGNNLIRGATSDLEALSAKLHKQAADGKEAAKRAKKVDKAREAIGEFLADNGKLLSEAGIVATFKAEG